MLNNWRLSEILTNNCSPLLEKFAFSESYCVVLKSLPMDVEGVTIGLLDSFMHNKIDKSWGGRENFRDCSFYGNLKIGMKSGFYFNECNFKNHNFSIK